MTPMRNLLMFFMFAAAACGGTQDSVASTPVGEGGSSSAATNAPDETDEGSAGERGEASKQNTAAKAVPAVTFRLKNSAKDELVFSLDKGWQPVIFAFSGKPPKATPILMFPKFCTAACDLDEADRCPYCAEPEKVKDIKAAEKREVVAPGASLDVPWDGQVHVYENTRGKREGKSTKCECFRKQPVPPESYTVRACGLRITKSAKSSTKYQCVEATMNFPAEGPQTVELDFPKL
jgi:hypothetical protein